jgi:hypothetical protein
MIFSQSQIIKKKLLGCQTMQYKTQCTLLTCSMVLYVTFYGWHLFTIGLDLNIVILDKATLCLRHYVSDIYLYHYMHCKVIQLAVK